MKINDTLMHRINASSCTEAEMRDALDGHLTLSYASFGNDRDMIEGGHQTIAEWKESYLRRTGMNHTQFSDYAGFTYDAILVYAKALQQLIKEGENGRWACFVTLLTHMHEQIHQNTATCVTCTAIRRWNDSLLWFTKWTSKVCQVEYRSVEEVHVSLTSTSFNGRSESSFW